MASLAPPDSPGAGFRSSSPSDPRLSGWDIFSLGYATTLALDVRGLWRGDPELAFVADLLRTDAEFLLRSYRSLAVIGHSMGGLAVQRALVDDPHFAVRLSCGSRLHDTWPT